MTGIVNSTGARSGVIGTTVGTPAAAGGKVVWSGWQGTAEQTNNTWKYPTLNTSRQTLDTDYATISTNTITIVKAGHYHIEAEVYQYTENSTQRYVEIQIDGSRVMYSRNGLTTSWTTNYVTYSEYLSATQTIKFALLVNGTDPYVWHQLDSSEYSLATLIFLGA